MIRHAVLIRITITTLLLSCSLLFGTTGYAQETAIEGNENASQGQSQQRLYQSDPDKTHAAYWTTEPTHATTLMTADQTLVMPGAEDIVDLIVMLDDAPLVTKMLDLNSKQMQPEEERGTLEQYNAELVTKQESLLRTMAEQELITQSNQRLRYLINAVAVSAPQQQIDAIAQLPGVSGVFPDYQAQISLDTSVPLVGAPAVWAQLDSNQQNIQGQGIDIAIIDTGIDYTHPDLGGCFGAGCRVVDGYDFVNSDADPMDDNNHGTHVAGIAAGRGTVTGVAPYASLFAYKVCDAYGSCATSDIIAGIDRAANPDGDPLTNDAVDVINMSLGGPGSPTDPLSIAANQAMAQGIVVVAAAGNNGTYRSIGAPGAAEDIITVGASTDSDGIAAFSSKGWAGTYQAKPDLVAPGQNINAPIRNNGYANFNGTSMATPHVAGAAALLKQAHPNWSPQVIKAALMNSALDIGHDPFAQGSGRLRVDEASQARFTAQPGILSFGLDPANLATWSKTLDLTLSNLTNATQSYNVTISPGIATGITVALGQSQVTLNAGQSTVVQVTVTVDNNVLPIPTHDSYAYHGAIEVGDGTQVRRVPFVLVRAAVLELQPSADEWPVLLRSPNGTSQFIDVAGQTSVLVPVQSGTYQLYVGYGYNNNSANKAFVLKENIAVTNHMVVPLTRADATHTWQATFQEFGGATQTVSDRSMLFLRDKQSGWWSMIKGAHLGAQPEVSPISNDYYLESCAYRRDIPAHAAYDLCFALEQGIQSVQTQQLLATDLKPVTYTADPEVGTTGTLPLMYYMPSPLAGLSVTYYPSLFIAKPVELTIYHTPLTSAHALQRSLYMVQQDSTGNQLPALMMSPVFSAADSSTLAIHPYHFSYISGWQTASYQTTTDAWSFPMSPVYWAGHFQNSTNQVQVDGNGLWGTFNGFYPLLQDQFQNIILGRPMHYNITSGAGSSQGNLETNNSIAVVPGAVTLEVDYTYRFEGADSQGHVTASVNTNGTDKNPPFITELTILDNNGQRQQRFVPGTAGQVQLGALDDVAIGTAKIAIDWGDGQGWQILATTQTGDTYTANIPTYSGTTDATVALRLTLTDSSGNQLQNTMSPAFVVESAGVPVTPPAAPSNLTAIGVSASQIELSWTDNSNNEDHFELFRSLDSTVNWQRIAILPADTTSYVDSDPALICNETYRYRVRARNSAGRSSYTPVERAQLLCTTGAIFADGFESGDLSAWSASRNPARLTVNTSAALVDIYGLEVSANSNTAVYLTDDSPYLEQQYQARIDLDPNSLPMAHRNLFTLFMGYEGASTPMLRIDLRYLNGTYRVRAGSRLDSNTWRFTSSYTISNAPHSVEIGWQAATAAGANDGSLTLWIDGQQKQTIVGLDNDTRRLDRARLGGLGIDTGTRGTYYLDDFVSTRDSYIGPSALVAAANVEAEVGSIQEMIYQRVRSTMTTTLTTATLTTAGPTTLVADLDGPVATVTAATPADSILQLTTLDDETLPDGYERVGDALEIEWLAQDGTQHPEGMGTYTVSFTYDQLDASLAVHQWNATAEIWEVVPANFDANSKTLQVSLEQSARLALMVPERLEQYELLLPMIINSYD